MTFIVTTLIFVSNNGHASAPDTTTNENPRDQRDGDFNINSVQNLDLLEMNLESLMAMQVTSVGKKEQSLSSSAAAIYVITAEDIKHSGVTTIADALKMVPGLHVARISSDKWAINSRDLGSRFAETLLVLIDGRSVYTPSFSGVYWEVQDTLMSDIDRIEVIRGPGATLWGANAVNGVINIMTKHTKETRGGVVEAGVGDLEKGFGSFRYGIALTENLNARIYTKGFKRASLSNLEGDASSQGWESLRGGFRMDADLTHRDFLTMQGEIYDGEIHQYMDHLPKLPLQDVTSISTQPEDYFYSAEDLSDVSGGHLRLAWQKIVSSSSEWNVQAYYDRYSRSELFIGEKRETVDVALEHRFSPIPHHDVVWGLRYNHTKDHFDDTLIMSAVHDSEVYELFSLFVQDEFQISPDRLWLTVGTKLENHEDTGIEILPSIRLFFSIDSHHKVWGAVSRAVRSPSRLERDGRALPYLSPPFTLEISEYPYTNPVPILYYLSGGEWFDSETLTAFEAGYRLIPSSDFSVDLSLYYNKYEDSRSFSLEEDLVLHDQWIEQPIHFVNGSPWYTYGGEISMTWRPMAWMELETAYALVIRELDSTSEVQSMAPKHKVSLQASLSPFDRFNLYCRVNHVDDSSQVLWSNPPDFIYDIEAYTTLDMAMVWKPSTHLELSLSIQNVLDEAHVEAVQEVWTPPEETRRSIYGKISWFF